MKEAPNALARALRDFFADHLPRLRSVSAHTVHSYRDSLVLFLRFVATRASRSVADLDLDDLGPQEVIAFLHHLGEGRHNAPSTSNVRLAALHAFFRYLTTRHPERLDQCQRILGVPFKRAHPRPIEYLDIDEIQAVLAAVDRTTADGRRDYVLLATMFNTGARVQELLDLRPCDLQLVRPHQVRLVGKGRKERICPLWPRLRSSCRLYWPSPPWTPARWRDSSATTAVSPLPASASATSWRSTVLALAASCRPSRPSGCTPTACGTAPRFTCSRPGSI